MRSEIKRVSKDLFQLVVGFCFYLFDSLILLFLPRKPIKKGHVLIVRLDHIGDFLIWSGQLATLRKKYPKDQYHLTLAGNSAWTKLIQSEGIFDEILPINRIQLTHSLKYRAGIASQLREAGFAVAINPTFSRELYRSDSIIRFSAANERIGFRGDYSNIGIILKWISNRWYTNLIETSSNIKNEFQLNAQFITGLGYPSEPRLGSFTQIPDWLPFGLEEKKYFVVVPGGSAPGKLWPYQYFVDISNRIRSRYGINGIICGTSSETNLAQLINEQLEQPLFDCTGKTSLIELMAIIKQSRILITNDTGPVHISPIVGTPTVCILGGGHFGRFLPYQGLALLPPMRIANFPMDCYGCNWNCRYNVGKNMAAPCVDRVSVDTVWKQVCELLG